MRREGRFSDHVSNGGARSQPSRSIDGKSHIFYLYLCLLSLNFVHHHSSQRTYIIVLAANIQNDNLSQQKNKVYI